MRLVQRPHFHGWLHGSVKTVNIILREILSTYSSYSAYVAWAETSRGGGVGLGGGDYTLHYTPNGVVYSRMKDWHVCTKFP